MYKKLLEKLTDELDDLSLQLLNQVPDIDLCQMVFANYSLKKFADHFTNTVLIWVKRKSDDKWVLRFRDHVKNDGYHIPAPSVDEIMKALHFIITDYETTYELFKTIDRFSFVDLLLCKTFTVSQFGINAEIPWQLRSRIREIDSMCANNQVYHSLAIRPQTELLNVDHEVTNTTK